MSKLAARQVRATGYSACIAAAAAGTPQRGSVHSVFAAAANILFPGECVLSLNACDGPQMPNGLQLSVPQGTFPFSALRPGMPILLGASRLHIEDLSCSLDLTPCPQWNPHIDHPSALNIQTLKENRERLRMVWEKHGSGRPSQPGQSHPSGRPTHPGRPQGSALLYTLPFPSMPNPVRSHCERTNVYSRADPCGRPGGWSGVKWSGDGLPDVGWSGGWGWDAGNITEIARYLCGRGVGLTPAGDDMLAGWMAAGWLLYGPEAAFLAACAQIMEVARVQTHLLSRCWLRYAAEGNVALPILRLLEALIREPDTESTGKRGTEPGTENNAQLELAAQAVLAMGATSGYDVISGILVAIEQFFLKN